MWMLIKLAWRNLFRNKRRTILSGVAIGVGLAALMFSDASIGSLGETMVHLATENFSGNAQIHQKGFNKNFEVEKVITNSGKILDELKGDQLIKGFAPRAIGLGMLTSTFDANNIMVYGIDPNMEKGVSKISSSMIAGEYLDQIDDHKVLLGKK